ncbi:MAG: AraC family transcriptional regulator [Flavobacteriaceae bacterium]
MLDFYNFVKDNPVFRQFSVDELLFTAYDCPIEVSPLDYWVDKNYFCYITKGGAKWKTPKQEYLFKVGDAAFLTKGAHRVFKILNGEFCALLIFMPDEFIRSVVKGHLYSNKIKRLSQHQDTVIPLHLDRTLTDYFISVLNYFSLASVPSKDLLGIKFRELIINIVTQNHNPALTSYFIETSNNAKIPLERVMEENFVFNLSMRDFAKLSGRSLATFNRDFSKIFGTSPGKWLKNKRLEYSKFLLETTNLNINEITIDAGFENTSHFVRVFKEKYRQPPLKFRRSLQNQM